MGEEDHPHERRVSHDDERARVGAIYATYAGDPRRARAWDATNPGNVAIRRELAAALWSRVPAAGLVLDVGCGTGWWLSELAGRGVAPARLCGVDLLEHRVAAARVRVPGAGIVAADARALPFDEGSVALVAMLTALSSMGHDDHRRAALREARRVCAPGGAIVVWEPRFPTLNRATARVSRALLTQELGASLQVTTVTVAPPLARRLGRGARAYDWLARIPALRSHRLVVATT